MPAAGARPPVSGARLALGLALLILGFVLWIVTDASAWGLLSGLGVVVLYSTVSSRVEAWRKR